VFAVREVTVKRFRPLKRKKKSYPMSAMIGGVAELLGGRELRNNPVTQALAATARAQEQHERRVELRRLARKTRADIAAVHAKFQRDMVALRKQYGIE
jgi:hypothetical protein